MSKYKILVLFFVGIAVYLLITLLVLRFYPDDPAQMAWMDREAFNSRYISRLHTGGTIKQEYLIGRLGSPDITEAFQHQQQIYQLLYYRTHRKAADGITTTDECTALLFIDRLLTAVGDEAVQQYQAVQSDVNRLR